MTENYLDLTSIINEKLLQNRNEMVSMLTPGLRVLLKGSGKTNETIWLGRSLLKPEWSNTCISRNDLRCRKNIEGAKVVRNCYPIIVQWYREKVVAMIEYVVDDTAPIVQSNNDLVLSGFDNRMHQVHGLRTHIL